MKVRAARRSDGDGRCDKIVIRPTPYGTVFLVSIAAMVAGAINYGNNLGFIFAFLLLSLGGVSVWITTTNIKRVEILGAAAEDVFAGETAFFIVYAKASLPCAGIVIGFNGSAHVEAELDDKGQQVKIPVEARSRGVLKPGPLLVSSVYPLGLFTAVRAFRIRSECTVFPKPVACEVPGMRGEGEDGQADRIKEGSEDFDGLKPFAPGDSLRHVAWKAFSRGQGLYTKRFSGQRGGRAVILDIDEFRQGDTEYHLSCLSYMVLFFSSKKILYGLKLSGVRISPSTGEAHCRACLRQLALF